MKIINFNVDDTRVSITEKPELITTGNVEYIKCVFDLSEAYSGLIVRASFNGEYRTVEEGECYAPPLKEGKNTIGVYGYTLENDEYTLVVSPKPIEIVASKGSFDTDEVAADNPTPSELEAHYELVNALVESGKMKGEKGDKGDTGERGADGVAGADGFSPSAKVERNQSGTGAKITITDKDGTTVANVFDGESGASQFIVEFTSQGGVYSADKTFSQIYSAYTNGDEIVGKFGVELYNITSISNSAAAFTNLLLSEVHLFIVTDNGVTYSTVNIQPLLSAGTGISISGNVISATLNWNIVVVNQLPAVGESQTFYFVPKQNSAQGDVYDEYVWVNNAFEHIGSTEVDLSNYYTKAETNTLVNAKQDVLTAGQNITLQNGVISSGIEVLKI